MATINCKQCGTTIGDPLKKCRYCGASAPRMRFLQSDLYVLGAAISLILILLVNHFIEA